MGKFGHKMREWREAWMSRNDEALDAWWGRWKTRPQRQHTGEIDFNDVPRTGEVDLSQLPTLMAATDDWNQPTVKRQVARPVPVLSSSKVQRDRNGRPYLVIHSDAPMEETDNLVVTAVALFYRSTGIYPSIILLKVTRYMHTKATHYRIGDVLIPYEAGWDTYDLLLKRY